VDHFLGVERIHLEKFFQFLSLFGGREASLKMVACGFEEDTYGAIAIE
jgi:hypothetical protein